MRKLDLIECGFHFFARKIYGVRISCIGKLKVDLRHVSSYEHRNGMQIDVTCRVVEVTVSHDTERIHCMDSVGVCCFLF